MEKNLPLYPEMNEFNQFYFPSYKNGLTVNSNIFSNEKKLFTLKSYRITHD